MGNRVKMKAHIRDDGTKSVAIYSDCEKYRYTLERHWGPGARFLIMIMLNPSTATEKQNDPTVERCERRARKWGFDGLLVLNIFAYRATDPKDMKAQSDPIGPLNDKTIMDALAGCALNRASQVVCGWGAHGTFMNRSAQVMSMMHENNIQPLALEWTKKGLPKHPLYIGYDKKPTPLLMAMIAKGRG